MEHDKHLGADAGTEADRLAGRRAERPEVGEQAVEAEPGLGPAAQRDRARPEVVALGAFVLGHEPVAAQRLDQAVGGADAEPGAGRDLADADVVVGLGDARSTASARSTDCDPERATADRSSCMVFHVAMRPPTL